MKIESFFFEWPFSVVPGDEEASVWADRESVRAQIERILSSFEYRPQSTVDLVWAAFGAGKTHLLYHLVYRARSTETICPCYGVVPEGVRSFKQVYRAVMSNFPLEVIDGETLAAFDENHAIYPVIYPLVVGNRKQRQIARDWLLGRRVDMRSAPKHVPIPYKLESADQMGQVFRGLIEAIVGGGKRLLLLLDEYQRVRTHRGKAEGRLGNLILDTFNAVPKQFSVVVSVSATQRATAYKVLPEELQDRMRGRNALPLSILDEEDALIFIKDLLGSYRPEDYAGSELAPFTPEGVTVTIKQIKESSEFRLIPRHIIQALDVALQGAVEEERLEIGEREMTRSLKRLGA